MNLANSSDTNALAAVRILTDDGVHARMFDAGFKTWEA